MSAFDDFHALIIGVGEYAHHRILDLPATINDAQALKDVVTDTSYCCYPQGNVQVLTGKLATSANIRAACQRFKLALSENSTGLIYFSGHGGRISHNGEQKTYLCTHDTNPDALIQTAISGDEFDAFLNTLRVHKLVVMLDACHAAGAASLRSISDIADWRVGLPNTYFLKLAQGSGRVIIASCKENQVSWNRSGNDYGLFTSHLLDGLKGDASVNDEFVRVLDLYNYVSQHVKYERPDQEPILHAKDIDNNFPLALTRMSTEAKLLAQQTRGWFKALKYDFEGHDVRHSHGFEWIIKVPLGRRRHKYVLVGGFDREINIGDVTALRAKLNALDVDEGWIITNRRISQHARLETSHGNVICYTFDELLDENADFDGYLDWLDAEIKKRGIDKIYVSLTCTKEDLDPITKQTIGKSYYDESYGGLDSYVDQWLDDPSKEHISVLGEFGTGKTWFALHYAWITAKRYIDAKARGVQRPRLPLVIHLRDYAKAVSIESLFSELFFRKYEIPLPSYSAFEELNRMGKLLLIFDGFDEMADRIDRQKMISNFWELARIVVPRAKVLLTCRTEHFPEAKEGRALLAAELQASTMHLTGEPPQFEVIELNGFNNKQIKQILSSKTSPAILTQIIDNHHLLDLARRPLMIDFILEALPRIEDNTTLDLSHIYFYAVHCKLERDIKEERTFTSLADKLYFLCEISWEMLSTNQMSLNYRLIPDRVRRLFGHKVYEQKDLDHWYYDMMGQTMLIRNTDGDYSPAHRSLLEFFVAYKLAAEIGSLSADFIDLPQSASFVNQTNSAKSYTWSAYFNPARDEANEIVPSPPLYDFDAEPIERLATTFGKQKITYPLSLLMEQMSKVDGLWNIVKSTRNRNHREVEYVGGNALNILLDKNQSLVGADLAYTVLRGAELEYTDISNTNLYGADLQDVKFTSATLVNTDLRHTNLAKANFRERNCITGIAFSPINNNIAYSSHDRTIRIWNMDKQDFVAVLKAHENSILELAFSPDGKELISAGRDKTIRVWDMTNMELRTTIQAQSGEISAIAYTYDGQYILSGDDTGTVRVWDRSKYSEIAKIEGFGRVCSLACHPHNNVFVIGAANRVEVRDLAAKQPIIYLEINNQSGLWWNHVLFDPSGNWLIIQPHFTPPLLINTTTWKTEHICKRNTPDTRNGTSYYRSSCSPQGDKVVSGTYSGIIPVWHIPSGQEILCIKHPVKGGKVETVAFDHSGKYIATGDYDGYIYIWDAHTGMHVQTIHNVKMNCQGARISGAKGLKRNGPEKKKVLSQWLIERGATLD